MKQEIKQNGITVLFSEDGYSIPVIFNNLTGKNFQNRKEYQAYIKHVATSQMGFSYGKIELIKDGKVVETGQINRYLTKR